MRCEINWGRLGKSESAWRQLEQDLGAGHLRDKLLGQLLAIFRELGAKSFVHELPYIDRDFSAMYSAFYASLYKPYLKYCTRIHFFTRPLKQFKELEGDPKARAEYLEKNGASYLGYLVLRPVDHAPVSNAVVSARHLMEKGEGVDISLRSVFKIHLLGAQLEVDGTPVTEQDVRTGACAQAVMWMALRHLHNRDGAPWVSMIEINNTALHSVGSHLASSLPPGSEGLDIDEMALTFRALGEHPLFYGRESKWAEPPNRILARYLESGCPVIIGLGSGHTVLAVGVKRSDAELVSDKHHGLHESDRVTHILINDDQKGVYREMAVRAEDKNDERDVCLEEAEAIFVLLPRKVFMTAETAESAAIDQVAAFAGKRTELAQAALGEDVVRYVADVDPSFYGALDGGLVARTYLTFGWKYKQRMLRNDIIDDIKFEIATLQLPRFVWVTEISLTEDLVGHCREGHRIRGHVVHDATGSSFWESLVLVHLPGVAVFNSFDPGTSQEKIIMVFQQDKHYRPKTRGEDGRLPTDRRATAKNGR